MHFDRQLMKICFIGGILSMLIHLSGCGNLTTAQNVGVWGTIVTAVGAASPAQEIEQIYYLGVFDPQEQIPPTVYRIRVHGQASILSGMKFGSGWAPARVIDSLGSDLGYDFNSGALNVAGADGNLEGRIQTGRRLIMFGPEGFREAPKDHRLVIVMGASPEKFFNALDRSLGVINQAAAEQRNDGLAKLLLAALGEAKYESIRLEDLEKDIARDLPLPEGDE